MAGPEIQGSRVSKADVYEIDLFYQFINDANHAIGDSRVAENLEEKVKHLERAISKLLTAVENHWL